MLLGVTFGCGKANQLRAGHVLDEAMLANRPPGPPDEAAVAFVRPMVEKASLALCVNEAWAMLACVAIAGALLVPFARDRPDPKGS